MASIINATTSTGLVQTADNSGSLQLQTNNGTTAVTIDTSQNVGIGTSSPSSFGKFAVAGQSSLGVDQTDYVNILGGGGTARVETVGGNTNINLAFSTKGTGATYFWRGGYGGTASMLIDGSGNLLVGTTSNYGTARTSINNSGTVLGLYCSGASGQPAFVIGKQSNDASTSQVLMQFLYNNGSAGLGQINGNGGSQAAFGSYSDIRLKENVVDLAPQLENIIALRPVEFDYKDGSGHQTGFIAQEIQNVFPEAVSVGHNEMLTVTGWNKTEAILVKAIQELKAELDATKAEVQALKGVA